MPFFADYHIYVKLVPEFIIFLIIVILGDLAQDFRKISFFVRWDSVISAEPTTKIDVSAPL